MGSTRTGKGLLALLVGAAVAVASAAVALGASVPGTPQASTMALTATEVAGAKVARQGAEKISDPYVANAYSREFTFNAPYGASKFLYVADEVLVTKSLAQAAAEYKAAGHEFSSPAGQRALQKEFVSVFGKGGTTGVTPVKPHALGFGDSAMEVGMIVHTTRGAVDISVSIFRVGKVVVLNVAVGRASKLIAADARALGNLGVAHINANLVPIIVSAPTVAGTAQQGQSLTGTNGTWGDEPDSYTYQWQHCDAAGANCTDVAGATTATYAVTATDVGFTLRLNVTATNRFGPVTAPTAVTAAVS